MEDPSRLHADLIAVTRMICRSVAEDKAGCTNDEGRKSEVQADGRRQEDQVKEGRWDGACALQLEPYSRATERCPLFAMNERRHP